MTELLVMTLAFVALCGCAIVAYTGLDAMEREEEEGARWAKPRRPRRPVIAPPDAPVYVAFPQPRRRGGSTTAHVDWLEQRVRVVEERLDQLVRESHRV